VGKWSSNSVAEHADRLAPLIELCQKQSNDQLAEDYAKLRQMKTFHEGALSEANLAIRAAEMVFAERFAENDIKSMKFNNGMQLTISVEQGWAFDDKGAFVRFLEDNGWHHELTVPANSLNRLMRDLEEAKLNPPGVKLGEPFTKFSCRGLK
jgi:hypothetical protein